MNVFIARDGAVIGEYARERLEEMARAGELQADDHYWQEGMDGWLPLPFVSDPVAPGEAPRLRRDSPLFANGASIPPAVNGPTVFIARDGVILGEYPRKDLQEMARAQTLQAEDNYWRDGMDDWLPLPELFVREAWEFPGPLPPPPNYRLVFGGIAVALVVAGIVGFFLVRPDRGSHMASSSSSRDLDAASALEIRDKAAADLRQRIERLPARAEPPLNTFYYDVRVNMKKTFSERTPWVATIHGFENFVKPDSGETISRTEFVLSADYQDGAWAFKHYSASAANMTEAITTRVEQDGSDPTPPSIVGMLGLRRLDFAEAVSIKIPER